MGCLLFVTCFSSKLFCVLFAGIWRYYHKEDWSSSSFWHLWRACDTRTVQHGCWEVGGLPYWPGPVGQGLSSFELLFSFSYSLFISVSSVHRSSFESLKLAVKLLQTITMWELKHVSCIWLFELRYLDILSIFV